MWKIVRHLGIATLVVTLASACKSSAPLHVIVDPTLARGDVYEVTGKVNRHWGKPLSFGGFATRQTRVGSTWSWTGGVFGLGGGVSVQPYRFVFVGEQGEEWQVECRAKTPILRHADEHGSWTIPLDATRLGCALRNPSGEQVRALSVVGNGLDFRGETDCAGEPIAIRALHQIPDRDGNPRSIPGVLGYELRQGGRIVGGVDLLGRGRVYLAPEMSPELRTSVAMTATVLMFFGEG